MSSSSALLQSVISNATSLRNIARIRVRMVKVTQPTTKQTSLRIFTERRLPVLRFHNPSLAVEISRLPGSTGAGIEVSKGSETYLLGHADLRDDELLASIVALDKATTPEAEAAVAGVTKGTLPAVTPAKAAAPQA